MNQPVFAALADPGRRAMIETLSRAGSGTATGLAGEFNMSRQAAAKHLRLLSDAGLVRSNRVGRETRYQPAPEALSSVTDWITTVSTSWTARLDAIARATEQL